MSDMVSKQSFEFSMTSHEVLYSITKYFSMGPLAESGLFLAVKTLPNFVGVGSDMKKCKNGQDCLFFLPSLSALPGVAQATLTSPICYNNTILSVSLFLLADLNLYLYLCCPFSLCKIALFT